jgi:hypothetical protein
VKFEWTVLPHPPFSSDLAPSDFHLFCLMKNGLRGQCFSSANAVIVAARNWLAQADDNFYERGIQCLVQHWRTCIERGGDCVEK